MSCIWDDIAKTWEYSAEWISMLGFGITILGYGILGILLYNTKYMTKCCRHNTL